MLIFVSEISQPKELKSVWNSMIIQRHFQGNLISFERDKKRSTSRENEQRLLGLILGDESRNFLLTYESVKIPWKILPPRDTPRPKNEKAFANSINRLAKSRIGKWCLLFFLANPEISPFLCLPYYGSIITAIFCPWWQCVQKTLQCEVRQKIGRSSTLFSTARSLASLFSLAVFSSSSSLFASESESHNISIHNASEQREKALWKPISLNAPLLS